MRFEVGLTGKPSTGYTWKCNAEWDELLHIPRVPPPPDGEVRIGGETVSLFTFFDIADGERLVFEYLRPWETGSTPIKTVVVVVHDGT